MFRISLRSMFWRAVYRFSTVEEGKRHLRGGILIIAGQGGNVAGRGAALDPEEMREGRKTIFFFFQYMEALFFVRIKTNCITEDFVTLQRSLPNPNSGQFQSKEKLAFVIKEEYCNKGE